MKSSPSLLPDLYLRQGVVFGTDRRVFQYRVDGLPDGTDIQICEFGGRWRIFRAKRGAEEGASRSYPTAEDAFNAFRHELG